MPSANAVWCVQHRFSLLWCATNTGNPPPCNRARVRALCGRSIMPRMGAEHGHQPYEERLPDCQRCLDILGARAQQAAKAADDPAQGELGLT